MNSIDIRTEKFNAIFTYRSFQTITNLFRFIEICVFLVAISTFSVRFVSADYFRTISFAGVSPRFVFVIGNVIVLILLFKSRVNENGKIDVYDEYVKRCEKNVTNRTTDIVTVPKRKMKNMMSVDCENSQRYRKLKESVTERKTLNNIVDSPEICNRQSENLTSSRKPSPEICNIQSEDLTTRRKSSPEICNSQSEKITSRRKPSPEICDGQSEKITSRRKLKPEICRSQSEKVMKLESKESESCRKLRRSVTDCSGGETPVVVAKNCEVDEMSSEAFRRTVEAFIARQQQSLRDEELAPVPYRICTE